MGLLDGTNDQCTSNPQDSSHHWHDTGRRKLMYPPLKVEVCCHCGKQRFIEAKYVKDPNCGPCFEGTLTWQYKDT
jgi:hypothetical protein